MTTEDIANARIVLESLNEVLLSLDGVDNALSRIGLHTEAALIGLSVDRIDFVFDKIEQKILEAEPTTELEQQEHDWEADNNR